MCNTTLFQLCICGNQFVICLSGRKLFDVGRFHRRYIYIYIIKCYEQSRVVLRRVKSPEDIKNSKPDAIMINLNIKLPSRGVHNLKFKTLKYLSAQQQTVYPQVYYNVMRVIYSPWRTTYFTYYFNSQ